jgi:hypothetical protein
VRHVIAILKNWSCTRIKKEDRAQAVQLGITQSLQVNEQEKLYTEEICFLLKQQSIAGTSASAKYR